MSRLLFELDCCDVESSARSGRLHTRHGIVETPVFMPVGTRATVRTLGPEQLENAGAQILLANTYHLLLKPGPDVFRHFGGIHSFMDWKGSILTDSGGFQVFSLAEWREIHEEGVWFRPGKDVPPLLLSPERSIEMQVAIGSDIMMAFDECVPATADFAQAEAAVERTFRWAQRSLAAREDAPGALFGIVQGACHPALRERSAAQLTCLPFDGFAIGGLAVGETKQEREHFTALTARLLPVDKPRYLMGVGTPLDLLEAVWRGVDLFDCILPTSMAQQGLAYTFSGIVKLRRTAYRLDDDPLDPNCSCLTCRRHSRGYLHHLIKSEEVLGWNRIALHNVHFYLSLMSHIRSHIRAGSFGAFYREQQPLLMADDSTHPMAPGRRGRVVKRAPLERGDYAVEDLPGFSCIRQRSSGERMHGGLEPAAEAALLYVEPSGLPSRLFEGEEPLVIWDVGLGAAANAMGVILEVERLSALFPGRPMRTVQLVSFEQDLDPFRLLASHPERFPQARHAAPLALLKSGQWTSTRAPLHWQLLEGDFASRLEHAPAPDLLYYDPFSPRTDGPLWTWSFFSKLFQCLTAASAGRTTTLLTYSNATPVRAALLAAGFWVAYGPPTGARPDTTRAYTLPVGGEVRWLEVDWLQRWARSGARVPEGLDPGERLSFETRIWTHPQFRRSPDGWTQALAEAYFRLSVDAHAGGASDRAAAFGERAVEGFRTLQNSDGLRKALASQRIYLKALADSTALEIVEGQLAALSAERQASRGTND